jgi:hypothetical protein
MADWGRLDVASLSGLSVLLVSGVVSPSEAFAGLSSSAVLAVGALYVVAGGA